MDKTEGVADWAKGVVEEHGRAVFEITMQVGLAGLATEELSEVLARHNSRKGFMALQQIATGFNKMVALLCAREGITPEQITACDTAIKLAFERHNAGKIVVASGPLVH